MAKAAEIRLEAIAALYGATAPRADRDSDGGGSGVQWIDHRLFGLAPGIVDAAFAVSASAQPDDLPSILQRFLKRRGPLGARVIVNLPDDCLIDESRRDYVWGGYWARSRIVSRPVALSISGGPDGYLARLGRHTQRNIRRSRKIADALGLAFSFRDAPGRTPDGERMRDLIGRHGRTIKPREIARLESFIAKMGGGFEATLETPSGELASYCRGFVDDGVPYVVYQFNDLGIHGINVSLLNRDHLIGHFSRCGFAEVRFLFGCAGLLRPACAPGYTQKWIAIRLAPAAIPVIAAMTLVLPMPHQRNAARSALKAAIDVFANRAAQKAAGVFHAFRFRLKRR